MMTNDPNRGRNAANNSPLVKAPRQLLIDVSVIACGDAGTGIQRVVRAIWTQLREIIPPDVALRPVMATKTSPYRYCPEDFLDHPADATALDGSAIEILPGDLFLGLDFAPHLLPRHEGQLKQWKAAGALLHILLYDLLPLKGRRWFRSKSRRNFRRWLHVVEQQADQVFCISDAVIAEVAAWSRRFSLWPKRSFPVARLHLGSDLTGSSSLKPESEDIDNLIDWVSRGDTILMVGTIEPRKAYDKAIAACEWLWREKDRMTQLLIVGRPGWRTARLQGRLRELGRTETRFRWIDNASDQTLDQLYRRCNGVLMTSYAEGLGLPIIEAAAHGTPALVRDIAVFRELDCGGLSFFRDDNPKALASKLLQWLESRCLRHTLPSHSITWRETADELLGLLKLSS